MTLVSLFIPIYNEERIIDFHIRKIKWVLENLPQEFEIFIVDDASTDNSKRILKEISESDKVVHHLRYEAGPTRRENLAQSFKKANGEIIAFMDMDLATNLKHLPTLISEVEDNADIAIGSRYVPGAKIKRRLLRRVISIAYNYFVRFYFSSKLSDHECGFKAFKRQVILNLVKEMGYDETLTRGVFWDTELLVRAQFHSYKIKEIPIEWTEADKSALNFRREIKMIPYLLRFKKRLKKEQIQNS